MSLIERVVPSRNSNTALTFIQVRGEEPGLRLSGTNLEIDIELLVPAEVIAPSTFVVPAQLLSQVIRALPGELVEFQLKENELTASSGGSIFKLQTGALDTYPTLEFLQHSYVTLNGRELSKSIAAVRYAAAVEEYRQIFRGVQFEISAERSRVVATDGYRLALRDFAGASDSLRKVVIPARSADELVRVLRDETVKVSINEGTVTICTDRARLNIKSMEGELPDYERVIPHDASVSVEVSAAQLRESVSRVAIVADRTANNKVEFIVASGKLRLVAESDHGQAQDILDVHQEGREPAVQLGFRAKQIIEAITPIEGNVIIGFNPGNSGPPAVFKSSLDLNYLAIVNPLRM